MAANWQDYKLQGRQVIEGRDATKQARLIEYAAREMCESGLDMFGAVSYTSNRIFNSMHPPHMHGSGRKLNNDIEIVVDAVEAVMLEYGPPHPPPPAPGQDWDMDAVPAAWRCWWRLKGLMTTVLPLTAADFAAFREEMYSNTIHMPIQAVQKLHDELWGATSGNAGPLVQLARKLLKIDITATEGPNAVRPFQKTTFKISADFGLPICTEWVAAKQAMEDCEDPTPHIVNMVAHAVDLHAQLTAEVGWYSMVTQADGLYTLEEGAEEEEEEEGMDAEAPTVAAAELPNTTTSSTSPSAAGAAAAAAHEEEEEEEVTEANAGKLLKGCGFKGDLDPDICKTIWDLVETMGYFRDKEEDAAAAAGAEVGMAGLGEGGQLAVEELLGQTLFWLEQGVQEAVQKGWQ